MASKRTSGVTKKALAKLDDRTNVLIERVHSMAESAEERHKEIVAMTKKERRERRDKLPFRPSKHNPTDEERGILRGIFDVLTKEECDAVNIAFPKHMRNIESGDDMMVYPDGITPTVYRNENTNRLEYYLVDCHKAADGQRVMTVHVMGPVFKKLFEMTKEDLGEDAKMSCIDAFLYYILAVVGENTEYCWSEGKCFKKSTEGGKTVLVDFISKR